MDTKARAAESNDTSRSYITIRGPFFGPDPENTGVRGGPHASHCPIPFARNPPLRFLIPANNVSCNLSSHLYQPNKIYIFLKYTDKYVKFVKNRFPTIILSLHENRHSRVYFSSRDYSGKNDKSDEREVVEKNKRISNLILLPFLPLVRFP